MSDCESEDYSSSEDEDYVPSGGEYSEDDINDLVKESGDDEDEEGSKKSNDVKSKKKRSKNYPARKRKKGVLVLGSQEGGENSESQATAPGETEDDIFSEIKQKKFEEAKKKREDDLWSSFLSDVGQKTKQQTLASSSMSNQTPVEEPKVPVQDKETEKQKEDSKMTITKVYDFAGEEVRVTKEVDSSSKEAKAFIKQQEKSQPEPSPVSSKSSVPGDSGLKRPVGMSSILGQLGAKKQKISTLAKSKLDWETFKAKEGISEELAIHNRGKDGYIERKAFLERVDYRQFEQERDIRLKNMKPSQ